MKKQTQVGLVFLACIFSTALIACAPTANGNGSRADAGEPVIAVEWSIESECQTCHVVEQKSAADASCLAAQHQSESCISCHADSASLEIAHDGASADGKMPKKLSKDNKITAETCLSCHESWDSLAEKTTDVLILTDEEGTTVNPHTLPDGHVGEKITCIDCHVVHKPEAIGETAIEACTSCHHENVYECNTCHA